MLDCELISDNVAVRSVFRFDNSGLTHVSGVMADAWSDATLSLWKTISNLDGATYLIAQTQQETSVVSAMGGTMIAAENRLNVALLLRDLASLEDTQVQPSPLDPMQFDDSAHQTLTAIAERLAGVETPRAMSIKADKTTFVLEATKTGFGIKDGQAGLAKMVKAIQTATKKKKPVRYTLKAASTKDQDATLAVTDFFHAATEKTDDTKGWQFSSVGWPNSCPESATFDTIAALSAVVKALSDWNGEDPVSVQVLDDQKRPLLKALSDEKRTWRLTVPNDQLSPSFILHSNT